MCGSPRASASRGSARAASGKPSHRTTAAAVDGTYHLTVSGTAGTIIRTTSVDLILVGHHAPVITSPGAQQSTEGNSVNVPISASDVDGDPLTFSASGLPTGLSIDTA